MKYTKNVFKYISFLCIFCLAACTSATGAPTPNYKAKKVQEGGTLRLYLQAGSVADPIRPQDRQMQQAMSLVVDNFLEFDADGGVIDNIAMSWQDEKMDSGETCWTFLLRQGIMFAGKTLHQLTAHDVAFSLDTIFQYEESPYYKSLQNILG